MMDLFAKLNVRAPAFVNQVEESLKELAALTEALSTKEPPTRKAVEAILFPKRERRERRDRRDAPEEE